MRIDVLLHRLCLTRSRTEARDACESGAILVGGHTVKPSRLITPGEVILLRFTTRQLEIRLLAIPPKSTSKKAAREMYEIVRDERVGVL